MQLRHRSLECCPYGDESVTSDILARPSRYPVRMPQNPADLFENVADISLSEFLARHGDGFREMLTTARVETLVERLAEHYQNQSVPSYEDGTLVPHVYDSDFNYATPVYEGFAPPRVAPSIEHVQHTLLYAHAVETYDLLPGALKALLCNREGSEVFVWRALRFWDAVRELYDCGILRTLPGIGPSASAFGDVVDMAELLKRESFQRDFRDFTAESWARRPMYGGINLDALSSEKRADVLHDFYCDEAYGGDLRLATDIARAYGIAESSNATFWLPSPAHWRYLMLLLKHGAPSPRQPDLETMNTMARLASLNVPGIGQLDAGTLSAVRRKSEVFEQWRTELGRALTAIARLEGFPEETQLNEFRTRMTGAAAEVTKGLRKEGGKLRQGTLVSFGVGLIGVGAKVGFDAITNGSPGHASGPFGAATAVAASAVTAAGIRAVQGRSERAAGRAAVTMAMVLAEPGCRDDSQASPV